MSKERAKKKVILSEEAFVEGLDRVIGENYFSSSSKRGQGVQAPITVQDYLQDFTSEDNASFKALQATEVRKRREANVPTDVLGITYESQQMQRIEAHPNLFHDTHSQGQLLIQAKEQLLLTQDKSDVALPMLPPKPRARTVSNMVRTHSIVPENTRLADNHMRFMADLRSDSDDCSYASSDNFSGMDISSTATIGLVPMTPIIHVESVDDGEETSTSDLVDNEIDDVTDGPRDLLVVTPIMTWGHLFAAPLLLDGQGPRASKHPQTGRRRRSECPRKMTSVTSTVASSVASSSRSAMSAQIARLPSAAQDLLKAVNRRKKSTN